MVVEKIAVKVDWSFLFLQTDFGFSTWCYIADDRGTGLFKVIYSVQTSSGTPTIYTQVIPRDELLGKLHTINPQIEDIMSLRVFGYVFPTNDKVTFFCYGNCEVVEEVGDDVNTTYTPVFLLRIDVDTFTGGHFVSSPFLSQHDFTLTLYTNVNNIPSGQVGRFEKELLTNMRNQSRVQQANIHPRDLKVLVSDFGEALWVYTVEESVQEDVVLVHIYAALHRNILFYENLIWQPVITYFELKDDERFQFIVHFAVEPSQAFVNVFTYRHIYPQGWKLVQQIQLPLGLSE